MCILYTFLKHNNNKRVLTLCNAANLPKCNVVDREVAGRNNSFGSVSERWQMHALYRAIYSIPIMWIKCWGMQEEGGRGGHILFFSFFTFDLFSPPCGGVGRSWRYCNTRPTRGKSGASTQHLTQWQKSV